MAAVRVVKVGDRRELRTTVNSYAAQNFVVISSDEEGTTLSRKKPFNWVLAIICLFIPIIGWIALGYMLFASSRGAEVVEIQLDDTVAATREVPRPA